MATAMSTPRTADPRTLAGAALAQALRDSRARTWALVDDLAPAQWQVPCAPGVNPIAWELAHLAWFAEFWLLRGPHTLDAAGRTVAHHAPRWTGPDALFDSAQLAHDARWSVALPTRTELVERLGAQLEACLQTIEPVLDGAADNSIASASTSIGTEAARSALNLQRLVLFHEDMHAEAFTWLRAALGLPAPAGTRLQMPLALTGSQAASVHLPGGRVQIGTPSDWRGFAFDNEQPAQTRVLADFEIDATPLSAGAFLRFVEAGGYDTPAFWPGPAGVWRAASGLRHPKRWRRDPALTLTSGKTNWQTCWFGRWLPLDPSAPLIHVNAYEADAYCHWAGRRLPRAAEWEHAAAQIAWGESVWEWTADAFQPYPGFVAGPYRDYSAPWFGDHRELRGGSFATSARLHDARYRNFFEPHRTDVFAGFRTVALTR